MPIITLADLDSLAYMAGYKGTWLDCRAHIQNVLLNIRLATRCDELKCYLQHWDGIFNFRNHLAVTKPYKGNRKDKEKPEYLTEAKKFIAANFNTTVCRTYEADDVVAIVAANYGYKVTIACIDKDLHQLPCKFYDYRKEHHSVVSEAKALRNLCHQMLMGDGCDNIPGIMGCGKVGAEKALLGSEDPMMTVIEEYKKRNLPYSYLLEQGRLLYLLRTRHEVWYPPITELQYNKLEVTA